MNKKENTPKSYILSSDISSKSKKIVMLQGELVSDEDTLLISEDNPNFLSNELSSPILISGAAKIDYSLPFDVTDQLLSSDEIK